VLSDYDYVESFLDVVLGRVSTVQPVTADSADF